MCGDVVLSPQHVAATLPLFPFCFETMFHNLTHQIKSLYLQNIIKQTMFLLKSTGLQILIAAISIPLNV